MKKTETITIRIRADLRSKLEQSAAKNQDSLNNEISVRLESSFTEEAALGGPKLKSLIRLIASRFIEHGRMRGEMIFGVGVTDEQWLSDKNAFESAAKAVMSTLTSRIPK